MTLETKELLDPTNLIQLIKDIGDDAPFRDLCKKLNIDLQPKNGEVRDLRTALKALVFEGILVKGEEDTYGLTPDLPENMRYLQVKERSIDGKSQYVLVRPEWRHDHDHPFPLVRVYGEPPEIYDGAMVNARLIRMPDGSYLAEDVEAYDETANDNTQTPTDSFNAASKSRRKNPPRRRTQRYRGRGRGRGRKGRRGNQPSRRTADAVERNFRGAATGKGRTSGPSNSSSPYENMAYALEKALRKTPLSEKFSKAARQEAGQYGIPPVNDNRKDIRHIPLVTIDGKDARDFDDAVFAEDDDGPKNKGGMHLVVAIADVAHYVRHGTALDQEAMERGNSTYLPDRVIPMLPEKLSNGLCSLKPEEDRACLAMHIWIDKKGKIKSHRVERALMKSRARLTYGQVQKAHEGKPDETCQPLMEDVINPLFKAYRLLSKARAARNTLQINLERPRVLRDRKTQEAEIHNAPRRDSHKLIEEMMIAANEAAATQLENKQAACVYRRHESPIASSVIKKLEVLRKMGVQGLPVVAHSARDFNRIMEIARGQLDEQTLALAIVRMQTKAFYSREEGGHFGLGLKRYAHFTSPIRRYSDLLVHRSLIEALGLGDGGLDGDQEKRLAEICEHISLAEERSKLMERMEEQEVLFEALAQKVGTTMNARILEVVPEGLKVRISGTGINTVIGNKNLPEGSYHLSDDKQALVSNRTGHELRAGHNYKVMLDYVDLENMSFKFSIVDPSLDLEPEPSPS